MATNAYMSGRIKWQRPQALLFSDDPGNLQNGLYIPQGNEFQSFIILSDHNRDTISISNQRIETRNRMVNGTMRSYYTADKINVSTSWTRLPSRAYGADQEYTNGELDQSNVFDSEGKYIGKYPEEYTADGGAGGADLLEWYEAHPGPFWVYMSYDKAGSGNLNRYTQVVQMYFSAFDYDVEKRGNGWSNGSASGFDMWNISLALEQV